MNDSNCFASEKEFLSLFVSNACQEEYLHWHKEKTFKHLFIISKLL